jgi:hypothetical protein
MGWSLVLVSGNSGLPLTWVEQSDLTAASAKKISVYLDQPHEISFTLPGEHPEAELVEELFCDVIAQYDGAREVRCRVGPSTDSADGASITTTIRALSYKEMVSRWYVDTDRQYEASFTGSRGIEGIGWQLLTQFMVRSSGGFSISRGPGGVGTASVTTNPLIKVDKGTVVSEAIDKLFEDTIYWWDIDQDMVFNTYQKGYRRRFLLDYGGSVASFQRTVDPSTYANAVRLFGGTPTTPPVGYAVPDASSTTPEVLAGTAPQGRWERYVYDSEEYSQSRAQSRADALAAAAQVVTPTYTMTLKPGMWAGPDDLWIGDVCPVKLQVGRLDVDTELIVSSMIFDIGDDGEETVTVTCDGLSTRDTYFVKQRKALADIRRLERR